jgi:Rrf2 family transcriptional regulator, cysteine metabolism repressor
MKLSTKGRYGLRLMIELALHEKNELVTLKEIAKQQEISQKYLWSLITPLQKAGLVRAERGARGGYMLARSASKITLRDIVVEVEGPLSIVECVRTPSICHRNALCVARDVWADISAKIENALESITLKDIVTNYRKKESAFLKTSKQKGSK